MKDEYKRQRKAELHLTRTLPDVESSRVYTPIHQDSLDVNCAQAVSVSAQGNGLIVVSTDESRLEVYTLNNDDNITLFNPESISETSEFSDNGLIPNRSRTSTWRKKLRTSSHHGTVEFIAPDVIGLQTPRVVSTWYVRSKQCLERVTVQNVHLNMTMCKISDTEFIIGSIEGHLCVFTHEEGCNLKESSRIWKAHRHAINFISFHKDTIVTTSPDRSARLWDVKTKRRLAVLYHNRGVFSAMMSDKYIVTCSWDSFSAWEMGGLRIYNNSEGYSLVKILRYRESVAYPIFLDDGCILCQTYGKVDENQRSLFRNTLMVVDIENECALAQLKVACRIIWDYTILADGKLVAVGYSGCQGVIITPPSEMHKLITSKSSKELRGGRQRMCSLM